MTDDIRILLIEDELPIRKFLKTGLSPLYHIIEAESGKEGLTAVATYNPKLIILDLGLPDMDGLEVTRRVREFSHVPIIILSAREQDFDKVAVLDAGADDYLTKPFSLEELQARIRASLRRANRLSKNEDEPIFENGGLKVDFVNRLVTLEDEELKLTPIEFKLLSYLVQNAGKVLTHNQLLSEVWGPAFVRDTQYLRVFMRQLRQKLKENPARSKFITTEPGVGYRFRLV